MASEKQQMDACPAVTDAPSASSHALEPGQDTSQKPQEPQKCNVDHSLNLADNCSASIEHQGEPESLPPIQHGSSEDEHVGSQRESGAGDQERVQEEAHGKGQGSDQEVSIDTQAGTSYNELEKDQEEASSHKQEMVKDEAGSNKQEIVQDEAGSKIQDTIMEVPGDTEQKGTKGMGEETRHKEEIIKEKEGANALVQEGTTGQEVGEDQEIEDGARKEVTGPETPEAVVEVTSNGGQGKGELGVDGGSLEEETEREATGLLVSGETSDHTEQREKGNISETAVDIQDKVDQTEHTEDDVTREETGAQGTGQETQGEGKDTEVMDTTEHPHDTCVKETGIPVKEEVSTYGEGEERAAGEHGTGEDISSAVKVTGSNVQVTAEEAGEAVTGANTLELGKDIQVAGGQTVTRFPVTGEETDTLTHVRGEEAEVTGDKSGVVEHKSSLNEKSPEPPFASTPSAAEEFTGARVKSAEVEADVAGDSGTGGQVSASGEKAERKVTPDPAPVPSGEGAVGPDRPAACREKEWPLLMCTGREERADAAGQAEIREEKVTEKELRRETPEMKDREYMEVDAMPPAETPIEREIRLAIERENILRQERGICSPSGQHELVEVRRRTLVVDKGQPVGKERQLAGAQMQRDIQLETRREQDLVQIGMVMGTYDRGPQQELQERKQMFENVATAPSEPVFKKRQSSSLQAAGGETPISLAPALSVNWPQGAPTRGGRKGPSYTEANGSNIILIEHSLVLQRSAPATNSTPAPADLPRPTPADLPRPTKSDTPQPASGKPYQATRSSSPRSLLEREIEEVQEREQELRKQRTSVYGRDEIQVDGPKKRSENRGDVLSGIYQPERPNWRKLDVNWPPNPDLTTNGQQSDQSLDSPRRQRSALIRSWEAGTPSPLDE